MVGWDSEKLISERAWLSSLIYNANGNMKANGDPIEVTDFMVTKEETKPLTEEEIMESTKKEVAKWKSLVVNCRGG